VDDLAGLRMHMHDELAAAGHDHAEEEADDIDAWVPAAGVPWFVSLFGRDSLVVSMQTLPLAPRFALGSLHALAHLQGDAYDGDLDGDGLQEYKTRAGANGYYNQGWKDASDGIVDADGKLSKLPIALCEHQAYVVAAKRAWADVVEEVWSDSSTAGRLRDEAATLAELLEDRFWWEEQGTYYLGLDGDKNPIGSVASNPGHLLWA